MSGTGRCSPTTSNKLGVLLLTAGVVLVVLLTGLAAARAASTRSSVMPQARQKAECEFVHIHNLRLRARTHAFQTCPTLPPTLPPFRAPPFALRPPSYPDEGCTRSTEFRDSLSAPPIRALTCFVAPAPTSVLPPVAHADRFTGP